MPRESHDFTGAHMDPRELAENVGEARIDAGSVDQHVGRQAQETGAGEINRPAGTDPMPEEKGDPSRPAGGPELDLDKPPSVV
jgi:hypothetical protein